jgi:hypothetical protein
MTTDLNTEIAKNKRALESLIAAIRNFKEDYQKTPDERTKSTAECYDQLFDLCEDFINEIDKHWTDISLLDMQIALEK